MLQELPFLFLKLLMFLFDNLQFSIGFLRRVLEVRGSEILVCRIIERKYCLIAADFTLYAILEFQICLPFTVH
jgi:hypothetical protein